MYYYVAKLKYFKILKEVCSHFRNLLLYNNPVVFFFLVQNKQVPNSSIQKQKISMLFIHISLTKKQFSLKNTFFIKFHEEANSTYLCILLS